ncbi:MAG: ribosome biogenesis GTPase Der [Spirochaetes bacterium]|nr:ribosome biogenesis GTPase Der [Spirochaetota bacterium]
MKKLPKILIIGRQNVGKSTLFNKMARKRQAIVDDKPGLTRDYMKETVTINDHYYELIDTGGLTNNSDKIEAQVKKQVLALLDQVQLVIFIVEKNGLAPLDFEIADLVRKANQKIILVINKIDDLEKIKDPALLNDFYELGFKNMIPISAEHKNNFDLLYDAIEESIDTKIEELSEIEEELKVAILGKPNVGKSSIINKLANSQRVIVTEIPGTTRDSIDVQIKYNNKEFVFIDTAGIIKRTRIDTNIEYYSVNRALKSIKKSNIVIMVISADTLISDADKKIFKFINDEKKPCLIAVNKWDLVKDTEENIHNIIIRQIKEKFPLITYLPIMFISAVTGHNIPKIFPAIIRMLESYNQKLPTSPFNEFVQKIINKNSPPQSGGHVKIYYATQISTAPPVFIFFTNKPDHIKENYKNFLTNRIREHYNFSGCPILVKFRKK